MVIATGKASESFRGMVKLNEMGKEIWQGIQNGLTKQQISEKLAKNMM